MQFSRESGKKRELSFQWRLSAGRYHCLSLSLSLVLCQAIAGCLSVRHFWQSGLSRALHVPPVSIPVPSVLFSRGYSVKFLLDMELTLSRCIQFLASFLNNTIKRGSFPHREYIIVQGLHAPRKIPEKKCPLE